MLSKHLSGLMTKESADVPFSIVGVTYNTGTSDYDLPIPTGTQTGDLLFLFSAHDNSPYGQGTPTGWTEYINYNYGVSHSANYVFYSGSVSNPVVADYGGNAASHMLVAIRGVDTITTYPTYSYSFATAGMPNAAAFSATAGRYLICIGYLDDDAVTNVTAPTGYTLIGSNASGQAATVMAAYKEVTATGSDDPGAFGGSGTDANGAYLFEVWKA